jgi:hypothetical protein
VRAVAAIFEDHSMKVQRIDQANDIGRDLLVDLIEESGYTGEVIALQVKSGTKYKRSDGYAIPCSGKDAAFWRDTTVPIFGVVYDDELNALFWVNLSEWATDPYHPEPPTAVAVSSRQPLTGATLDGFLAAARCYLAAERRSIFGLLAGGERDQLNAVADCFALGRRAPAPLLTLRQSLTDLSPAAKVAAVDVLGMCAGHGDVIWNATNWIESDVQARVRESFHWTYDELVVLLSLPDPEEWHRGGRGQSVAALVAARWNDNRRLLEEIGRREELQAAWPALMLLVTYTDRGALAIFERVVNRSHSLPSEPVVVELHAILRDGQTPSLF